MPLVRGELFYSSAKAICKVILTVFLENVSVEMNRAQFVRNGLTRLFNGLTYDLDFLHMTALKGTSKTY